MSGLSGGSRNNGCCWLCRLSFEASFWPRVSPGSGHPQCMYATWKRDCHARHVRSKEVLKCSSSTLSSLAACEYGKRISGHGTH